MTDSTPLRIKRIKIKGLFGLYDHVIDLNLEDRARAQWCGENSNIKNTP